MHYPLATKDNYSFTVVFTLFKPMTMKEFADKWQELAYDQGGFAGFFKVISAIGNEITVKFLRYLTQDGEYGIERNALDPSAGLLDQFKGEIDEVLGLYCVGYVRYYRAEGPNFTEDFYSIQEAAS